MSDSRDYQKSFEEANDLIVECANEVAKRLRRRPAGISESAMFLQVAKCLIDRAIVSNAGVPQDIIHG